jgi:hypothetical protein
MSSWIIRVVLTVGRPFPLNLDQRTFAGYVGTSQTCTNADMPEACRTKEKSRPKAASQFNPIIVDQAAINTGFDFRR